MTVDVNHLGAADWVDGSHSGDNQGAHASLNRRRDQIRGELTRILYRNCPAGVIGAATASSLLAGALWQAERVVPFVAALWAGLIIGCAALHLGLCWLYWRAAPADHAWPRWLGWFSLLAMIEGICWCLGAVWMTAGSDPTQELVVLLVSLAVASGAVQVFGAYLPTFAVFFLPTMAPYLGFSLLYPTWVGGLLFGLWFAYVIAMSLIARGGNQQLLEGLQLRFENADLVDDLRRQKDRADQANIAKSRFLASASHDLRQPIHALNLFVGALRGRKMDGEARRLVNHIGGSVRAMDDLFGSLLDISMLDAGAVEPQIETVALAPLLERLCRDYRHDAEAKGIALRLVPSSAIIRSDPVLLERILRNIIANAVHYTETGRVLVGCRSYKHTVMIDVWDTGPGIPADQQQKIFEEFYQIGNPERDRSKGLGLGLSIVKRIATLLDCRLTLVSEPGRGSGFRLQARRAPFGSVPALRDEKPLMGAMRPGLILVIDDELAIQQAMTALMSSWGHRVIVAGSLDEMLAQLICKPERPDLIICDFRLRDGETGIAAIEGLRERYGVRTPAMLITGDTAPDRISEAQASGFLLLHKPLSNGKLRAAIGNLMRQGALSAKLG